VWRFFHGENFGSCPRSGDKSRAQAQETEDGPIDQICSQWEGAHFKLIVDVINE
jgi:hypothetical protein